MDQYQTNINFIFDSHAPERSEIKTSLFSTKAPHWVIAAKDKSDLEQLKVTLEKTYFKPDDHFTVRGLNVIFTEKGEYKLLKNQKTHEMESNPHWLAYVNLCAKDKVSIGEYKPYYTDVRVIPGKGFTSIDYVGRTSSIVPKPDEEIIAKFHLSLDKPEIAKAWDAVAKYLVDNHVICKVVTPEGIDSNQLTDADGKSIVLYVTRKNIMDFSGWQRTLEDMEAILVANNIKPGGEISTDRPVEGSRYFHLHYGNTVYDRETGKGTAWDDDLRVLNGGVDSFAKLEIHVSEDQARKFQEQLTRSSALSITSQRSSFS